MEKCKKTEILEHDGNILLDKVVDALNPCFNKTLVFEVPFPHFLRQSVKGVTDADEFRMLKGMKKKPPTNRRPIKMRIS